MQGVARLLLEAKLDCQYAPLDFIELTYGSSIHQDFCDKKQLIVNPLVGLDYA